MIDYLNTHKKIALILCISLPILVGFTGAFATSSGVSTWYQTINKPWFTPPNWLFGPAWTTLYILMGISLYKIIFLPNNKLPLTVFFIQLVLNFFWSFIFFYFVEFGWALTEIIFLWISILAMIILFYKQNKIAALLNLPYLLWVSFATCLNCSIWLLN